MELVRDYICELFSDAEILGKIDEELIGLLFSLVITSLCDSSTTIA